jgi:hypothetical protein
LAERIHPPMLIKIPDQNILTAHNKCRGSCLSSINYALKSSIKTLSSLFLNRCHVLYCHYQVDAVDLFTCDYYL